MQGLSNFMEELGGISDFSVNYLVAFVFNGQDEAVHKGIERGVLILSDFGLGKERFHFEMIKRKHNQCRAMALELRGMRR